MRHPACSHQTAPQPDLFPSSPVPSILRKALDKIAEIKSLLEERRIGEWERPRAALGYLTGRETPRAADTGPGGACACNLAKSLSGASNRDRAGQGTATTVRA